MSSTTRLPAPTLEWAPTVTAPNTFTPAPSSTPSSAGPGGAEEAGRGFYMDDIGGRVKVGWWWCTGAGVGVGVEWWWR